MINDVNTDKFINDSMMSYSAYVLMQRALPDFRDGLKPVQRRIIYSMHLNNTKNLTKSATVTGRVYELHPHGDTYGTVINMVQQDKQNIPYLLGKGSWGRHTSRDQTAAAARYTEVKLGKPALETLKEIPEKSVDFIPNYDGKIMVPEVLPVTYPTILTNYASGVAPGFASTTLSYNLLEIREAILEYYKTGKIKTLVPDFSTSGYVLKDDETFEQIMQTGRGSITLRSKAEIKGNKIIVTEIPYSTTREEIIDKIVDLNKQKKLPEVTDVRDGTSFSGMKIVITVRRTCDPNEVLQKLYLMTPLQNRISSNTNVIMDGYPREVGVRHILKKWLEWREGVIRRGIGNKLQQMKKDLHMMLALEKIKFDIDAAINIIRFEKDEEVISKLMDKFKIDEQQADYISNIKLRNLNEARIEKQIKDIENRKNKINELEKNMNNEEYIHNQLINRMDASIKNIDVKERKTKIIEFDTSYKKVAVKIKKQIKKAVSYETYLTLTKKGYIFKTASNGKQVASPRPGDEAISYIPADNADTLFVLLPEGVGGTIPIQDININEGTFLPGYFEQEEILGIIVQSEEVPEVLLGFEDGQLARIPAKSFLGNRKILKNGYYKGSKLCFIEQIPSNCTSDIQINSGKRSKTFNLSQLNLKNGKISRGQCFVRPKNGEKVSFMLK